MKEGRSKEDELMQESFSLCPCRAWENIRAFPRNALLYFVLGIFVFWLDQEVKKIIVDGFRYEGSVISIVYVLNKGVAFSLFAFLGEWLKWIQLVIVVLLGYIVLTFRDFLRQDSLPFALIIGSGASNLYDRFTNGGVVDYVYWHYGFEFAIFNLADVFINIGIALFVLKLLFKKKTLIP